MIVDLSNEEYENLWDNCRYEFDSNYVEKVKTIKNFLPKEDQKLYNLSYEKGKKPVVIARSSKITTRMVYYRLTRMTEKILLLIDLKFNQIPYMHKYLKGMMSRRDYSAVKEFLNKNYSITDTARKTGLSYRTVNNAVKSGWVLTMQSGNPEMHKIYHTIYKNKDKLSNSKYRNA